MPGKLKLAHTPFLDSWREQLRAATAERGQKTEHPLFPLPPAQPNGCFRSLLQKANS